MAKAHWSCIKSYEPERILLLYTVFVCFSYYYLSINMRFFVRKFNISEVTDFAYLILIFNDIRPLLIAVYMAFKLNILNRYKSSRQKFILYSSSKIMLNYLKDLFYNILIGHIYLIIIVRI